MARPNPLAHYFHTGKLGGSREEESQIITQIVQDGLAADSERSNWLARQKVLSKLRFCLRPPRKDFPWPGASNLGIPYIDQVIRKAKPLLLRLITDPDPIVEFQGQDFAAMEAERTAEEFYHWLFKLEMDALEPIAYLVDHILHRGFGFVQVGWDYRTEYECRTVDVMGLLRKLGVDPAQLNPNDLGALAEIIAEEYEVPIQDPRARRALERAMEGIRQGTPFVKLAFRKVVSDKPAIWERDPIQILLPSRATDIANAEWIIVQHVFSLRTLQQMEADGIFEDGSVKKIEDHLRYSAKPGVHAFEEAAGFTQSLQALKEIQDERERVWGTENDNNILVWEVFHWTDLDGDGLLDRTHTFIHPISRTRLSSRPYAYPFHRWPIVKFDFEKTSRRWHSSRGISAMLEGLQREINQQHNNRLDGMTLRNAPTYQVVASAGFQARNWRIIPGQVIHIPGGARIEPIVQDRGPFGEQFNEENYLRNVGENYIGTFDAVINAPSGSEARTATEVHAAAQFAASTATVDAMLFQHAMRQVHELVWQLWLDLGQEEVFIKVMGEEAQPVGRIVRKSEIARRFKLVPTGTLTNTNRALELSRLREALQIFLQDPTGFINPFELRRAYLTLLDYRWARRLLNSPDQAQELQILRQAAQELSSNPELQSAIQGGVSNVPAEEVERMQQAEEPREPADQF